MSEKIKLIFGLAIPFTTALVVIGIIAIPRLLFPPQYDFLYATGEYYHFDKVYDLESGTLKREMNKPTYASSEPRIFRYSVTNDTVQEIIFVEARQLTLDSNPISPDGFHLECGVSRSSVLFGLQSRKDCLKQILKGHGVSKRLSIQSSNRGYPAIDFIGWVLQ